MSYRVDRTNPNNTPIHVDTSTTKKQLGITWVGQYYSRYGEIQHENTLRLVENFANNTPPNVDDDAGTSPSNVLGQLWYNTQDTGNSLGRVLKIYNNNVHSGTQGWKRLEPIISNALPTLHTEGEFWYQPSSNTLKMSRGTRWEEVTVLIAKDSEKLEGLTASQFVRSDVDDTVYGVLRTNEVMPDRHREYDLGKADSRWQTIYGETLNVEFSNSLIPEFPDTYDIGSAIPNVNTNGGRWRVGYFTIMDSLNYRTVSPLSSLDFDLGSSTKVWRDAHIANLHVSTINTFTPMSITDTMGTSSSRWNGAFLNLLDTTRTRSLIPDQNNRVLGTSASRWGEIQVNIIKGTTNTNTLLPETNNTFDIGSSTRNYRDLYVRNLRTEVQIHGDVRFGIVANNKSKGIVWEGLTDKHSIYVEETSGTQNTRLVIENGTNPIDYTLIKSSTGDVAAFKSQEVEILAGSLKTKGNLKVESTTTNKGCRMEYNATSETLDFIFY